MDLHIHVTFITICINRCMGMCMYRYFCVCMLVCSCIYICICKSVCIYTYVYMYESKDARKCLGGYTCKTDCVHMYIFVSASTCRNIYNTHAYVHILIYVYMHTYCACVCEYMCLCAQYACTWNIACIYISTVESIYCTMYYILFSSAKRVSRPNSCGSLHLRAQSQARSHQNSKKRLPYLGRERAAVQTAWFMIGALLNISELQGISWRGY